MNKCLEVKNLSISFGGLKAVDSLDFSINEGEIYGLIGPNGAGKTTVFNCVTQFYKPNTGEVLFNNYKGEVVDLTTLKTHNVIKQGIVRTFQNVELISELSVIDNLLVGAHIYFKKGFFSHAFRTPSSIREEKEFRKKAEEVLKFLDLLHIKDQLVSGQPYGVLKKIELGRTLMCNPKLIILDEPAAGLNDTETLALAKLLRQIRTEYKCSILLIEHDMRLVMDICDRLCAISFGKKLCEGTPSEIQQNKDVQEAYLGKADDDE